MFWIINRDDAPYCVARSAIVAITAGGTSPENSVYSTGSGYSAVLCAVHETVGSFVFHQEWWTEITRAGRPHPPPTSVAITLVIN